MGRRDTLSNWLDSRTGVRAIRKRLLDEPLPAGVGWWFVTGSVLLMLLAVQFATGVTLAIYYVPSPDFAYDTVRYVMERVTFGRIIRGLHVFGASFIVVAAIIHMMRVVMLGSYKKPREVTWLTGVALLLLILAFALSGYLLPWDQKAYWATTVTLRIARSGPFGESIAGLLQGGGALGALTLVRWYAAHVFLLPAVTIALVVAHLYLMRHHGISGALKPTEGHPKPFYPHHALKDTLVSAVVFSLLVAFAVVFRPPLDAIADPSDGTYVPRPEWYFLGLFQLLKYFPGRLEPIATILIPGVIVSLLFLLPFLDRNGHRHPLERRWITASFGFVGLAIAVLTYLGYQDTPAGAAEPRWTPLAVAGRQFVSDAKCMACHQDGETGASALLNFRPRRDPEWAIAHVRDPETITPGLRSPTGAGLGVAQAQAVGAFVRRLRSGGPPPQVSERDLTATHVLGRYCAACHRIDGEGIASGPDLTRIGAERAADWLRGWITNPEAVDPSANMPAFGDTLTTSELDAVVAFLSERR